MSWFGRFFLCRLLNDHDWILDKNLKPYCWRCGEYRRDHLDFLSPGDYL